MNTLALVAAFSLLSPAAVATEADRPLLAAAHRIAARLDAQVQDDWSKVRGIQSGSLVRVFLRDGTMREGKIGDVKEQQLILLAGSVAGAADLQPMPIERDAIREVQTRRPGSTAGAVIGTLVGGVAGAASAWSLAWVRCSGSCPARSIGVFGSLTLMPIAGGYLGWKLPSGWKRVYLAG